MININLAFTGNRINNKQLNNEKLEQSRAKSAAMRDLKLTQLDEDVVDFSYKKVEDLDFGLDDEIEENDKKSSKKSEIAEELELFDNFFRDYELEENGPKNLLKEEMGEFYQDTQYDEDDIPLSESIRPFRELSIEHFSPYRYTHDTSIDYESKHALLRMNYHNRIQSRENLRDNFIDSEEISDLAATLAEKEGKTFADRCVDMSVLRQSDRTKILDSNLFRFVSKHPGHRKHVVKVDNRGNETYNASYGRAYEKLLKKTNDVETIKEVLSSSYLESDNGKLYYDSTSANFAIDVFSKTQKWGDEEKMLVSSVKKTLRYRDANYIMRTEEVVDKTKLKQAQELLNSDKSIEECIVALNKEQ